MTQPHTHAVRGGGNNESLMPTKRSGNVADGGPLHGGGFVDGSQDYWQTLIDEKIAADFLGLSDRSLQSYRQKGGGPHYIRLSSRCLRYRRIDLREWAEARVRTSTSDPGNGAV